MNAETYTKKSMEALQTARSMALESRNNYITPEHILYALVDQDGGLIPSLLGKMGVDCNAVLSELDGAIAKLPKVGQVEQEDMEDLEDLVVMVDLVELVDLVLIEAEVDMVVIEEEEEVVDLEICLMKICKDNLLVKVVHLWIK